MLPRTAFQVLQYVGSPGASTELPQELPRASCFRKTFRMLPRTQREAHFGNHPERSQETFPYLSMGHVEVALIKGVAIALSCRAGKIPYDQICFLTSFETRSTKVQIAIIKGWQ